MPQALRQTYFATKCGVRPANDVRRFLPGPDAAGCAIDLSPDEGLGVGAVFRLDGHRGEPLTISFELLDPTSEVLTTRAFDLCPEADLFAAAIKLRADICVLNDHECWGASLLFGESVHLRWRVKVLDGAGRRIGRRMAEQVFSPDSPG